MNLYIFNQQEKADDIKAMNCSKANLLEVNYG